MRRCLPSLALLVTACAPRLECADAVGEAPLGCQTWEAPENRWPQGTPPTGLVASGMGVGQVAYDVRGLDQHGDEFSLWQLYGNVILFDVSTMWCRPCQQLASGTENTWRLFRDEGFVYVTVLIQDLQNGDVTVDELQTWAGLPDPTVTDPTDPAYAWGDDVITAPIVADDQGRSGSADAVRNNQFPAVLVIGRDMKVRQRVDPVSHDNIDAAVELALREEPLAD